MSGGSYEYLFSKDAQDLMSMEPVIQEMSDRLAKLGYAEDAALETHSLLLEIRQFKVRIQARVQRLSGVWRAVEWWDSCDSGEDGLKLELEGYRNPKVNT